MKGRDLLRYVGDPSQIFGIKDYRIIGSKAGGMRAIDAYTSKGLSFTVLPDRGMDIASLNYRGTNLSFMSSTGLTGSGYFCEDGAKGFLKNFNVGFLTTCGLTYMGAACMDDGEKLGLHGVISNTPAYEVSPVVRPMEQGEGICVSGKVKEARMFGENLVLTREISCDSDGTGFKIRDRVENRGFDITPLMLLYHINFGFPLLNADGRLLLPSKKVTPRDAEAQKGLFQCFEISPPISKYQEQVFFHDMIADPEGNVTVGIANEKLELMVAVTYNKSQLPHFTQWKSMCEGQYALGLEPGNCHVLGRDKAKADRSLEYINPGEIKEFEIKVNIIEGSEDIEKILKLPI